MEMTLHIPAEDSSFVAIANMLVLYGTGQGSGPARWIRPK